MKSLKYELDQSRLTNLTLKDRLRAFFHKVFQIRTSSTEDIADTIRGWMLEDNKEDSSQPTANDE